jgi:phosphatidate cytidylyltransferase
VIYGGAPLAALLAVVAAIGAWELFRIARAGGATPLSELGIALAGMVPLAVHARYLELWSPSAAFVTVLLTAIFGVAIWARGVDGKPLTAVAITVFGVLYVGVTLSFGYAIRYHQYAYADAPILGQRVPAGGLLLLLPMLVTWGSDTGAYAFGRMFGRHKLIPKVSPGKTVEGAIGGVITSVLVAWAYTAGVLAPAAQLGFKWHLLGIVAFGVAISVAAQVGDLAESLIKREAGVKDSSRILPGHGGILDRFDSLFFVLPLAYLLFGVMLTWTPR